MTGGNFWAVGEDARSVVVQTAGEDLRIRNRRLSIGCPMVHNLRRGLRP